MSKIIRACSLAKAAALASYNLTNYMEVNYE